MKKRFLPPMWIVILTLVWAAAWPTACRSGTPVAKKHASAYKAVGMASYYGRKFQGRRTASGERYDMRAMTAAHPFLKFGTRVEVTNLKNGRKVRVRINDRGPFIKGRIIDLSYAAARKIGLVSAGVAKVRVKLAK